MPHPMRGHACMPLRRHAIELHDRTDAEGASFMCDVRMVSHAIAAATGAVKLNYESHGNTVSHLHMHRFPRFPGDPFEGGPINRREVHGPVYEVGEFEQIRDRILEELWRDTEEPPMRVRGDIASRRVADLLPRDYQPE